MTVPIIKFKTFVANERWVGVDYQYPGIGNHWGRNWGRDHKAAEDAMLKTMDHFLGAGNYSVQLDGEKPFGREPGPCP